MDRKLTPMGIARLVMYVVFAAVGLAGFVVNSLGMNELGTLLGSIAAPGLAVVGGTAAFNLPKAPDQSPAGGFSVGAVLPALFRIGEAADLYVKQVGGSAVGRHALPEGEPEVPAAETGDEAYLSSVRGV